MGLCYCWPEEKKEKGKIRNEKRQNILKKVYMEEGKREKEKEKKKKRGKTCGGEKQKEGEKKEKKIFR